MSGPRRGKLIAAVLLCVTGVCLAAAVIEIPDGSAVPTAARAAITTSSALYLAASIVVFARARLADLFVLGGGLMAAPWLVLTERLLAPLNSWALLDYVGEPTQKEQALLWLAGLKLLAIALTAVTGVLSVVWLLAPERARGWLSVASSFAVLGIWFWASAWPYRVANAGDGSAPAIRIVHSEGGLLWRREIEVSLERDGRVWCGRAARRLFQYRFDKQISLGVSTDALQRRTQALVRSGAVRAPVLADFRLRRANRWYVKFGNSAAVIFDVGGGRNPPREVTDLFVDLQGMAKSEQHPQATRDVCLGFCYSPVGG